MNSKFILSALLATTSVAHADAPSSLDSLRSLKLKVGYDVGRTLVYGTGGWVTAEIGDTGTLPAVDPVSADGTLLGKGVAHLFRSDLSRSVELVKMDFDPFDGDGGFDSEITSLSARLSYRF